MKITRIFHLFGCSMGVTMAFIAVPSYALNAPSFTSTVDKSVVHTLAVASPIAHSVPRPDPAKLQWTNVAIEDRGMGRSFESGSLNIDFLPTYSYDSMPEAVMTVLQFHGLASFDGDRRLTIEQDNAGTFFARALLVRETKRVKFLLPSMFTNQGTGAKGFGILAFECDAGLTTCEAPNFAFSKALEHYGRPTIGLPGIAATSIPLPSEMSEQVLGCCLNDATGSCTCRQHWWQCPALCTDILAQTCLDCEEVFLCNCS